MPKITKQLTDLEVKNLTRVGRHAVGGVVGLCKQVRSSSSASWILKASINGQQKELGLGSCRT
ncbi:MAG: integrase, partial [Pseudomonadota bacterium]|nr:integrase [Pseudomonadota bacterium]